MQKIVLSIFFIWIVVSAFLSCDFLFSREISSPKEITITFLDKATKEPVRNVIVIANWSLLGTSFAGGGSPAGTLVLFELISDENGVIKIPSWGPKKVDGGLRVPRDPQLFIFKRGYKYMDTGSSHIELSELSKLSKGGRVRLVSKWDGSVLELEPFAGTDKEYVTEVEYLSSKLYYLSSYRCRKNNKTKRTLNLIYDMKEYFDSKNIKNPLPNIVKCKELDNNK